ncbi:hypothetical protein, partial [Nocardia sp. NPDC004260]
CPGLGNYVNTALADYVNENLDLVGNFMNADTIGGSDSGNGQYTADGVRGFANWFADELISSTDCVAFTVGPPQGCFRRFGV